MEYNIKTNSIHKSKIYENILKLKSENILIENIILLKFYRDLNIYLSEWIHFVFENVLIVKKTL